MQGLIEGRSVHYVAYNGRHLASIVTGTADAGSHDPAPTADLVVFTNMENVAGEKSGGVQFHFRVQYSETKEPGTWHWIEGAPTSSYPSTPAERGDAAEVTP